VHQTTHPFHPEPAEGYNTLPINKRNRQTTTTGQEFLLAPPAQIDTKQGEEYVVEKTSYSEK
jgi:hypothetical protein